MRFFDMIAENSPKEIDLNEAKLTFNELINYVTIISDAELELLSLRFKYPKEFSKVVPDSWKSPVYLADDVTHTAIMEIINRIYYLNQAKTINGQPSNFTDVVRVFENGFNFKFAKRYQTEEYVFKRKPSKITKIRSK